jgi:hypothetical protein
MEWSLAPFDFSKVILAFVSHLQATDTEQPRENTLTIVRHIYDEPFGEVHVLLLEMGIVTYT